MEEVIQEKQAQFKTYKALHEEGREDNWGQGGKDCLQWCQVLAKLEAEKEEFTTVSPDDNSVFRNAMQMDHTNRDAIGENCVSNNAGELPLIDEDKMMAEHYARLLNVELEWPSNELPEVPPIAGLAPGVSVTQICKTFSTMKCDKAAEPSEILKIAGEEGVELVIQLV